MERQTIDRQHVMALLSYLQRCSTIVPTVGAEWENLRNVLAALEGVATGKSVVVVEPAGDQPART